MTKQVDWSKLVLERFISLGNLTRDEEAIMRTRVAGWTITKQSMELGMSRSTVNALSSDSKSVMTPFKSLTRCSHHARSQRKNSTWIRTNQKSCSAFPNSSFCLFLIKLCKYDLLKAAE